MIAAAVYQGTSLLKISVVFRFISRLHKKYLPLNQQQRHHGTSSATSPLPVSSITVRQSSTSSYQKKKGLALVMGVANQRSIAWACVESFLQKNYDCIITYHVPQLPPVSGSNSTRSDDRHNSSSNKEKYRSKIEKLASPYMRKGTTVSNRNDGGGNDDDGDDDADELAQIVACIPCNVETDIPTLFQECIPNILIEGRTIDAIVHSIAYASEMDRSLLQTSSASYLQAQHVSAYSLIETIRECRNNQLLSKSNASITTVSYLGAVRTVPGYGSMSPAKAALECIVRTLAYEVNNCASTGIRGSVGNDSSTDSTRTGIRVNAVSAGPMKTISARGIPNFTTIKQHVMDHAPLQRNVTVNEVAETITWLSISGTGITGQTIYVDAGYSSIVPIV